MANKHVKQHSPSLITRKMQIKATVSYYTHLIERQNLKRLTILSVGETETLPWC